jgi:hypothetical protein
MFGFLVNSKNSKDANEEATGVSFTMLFNDGVNYDPLNPMKTHSWHKDAKAAGDQLSARVSSTNMHPTYSLHALSLSFFESAFVIDYCCVC